MKNRFFGIVLVIVLFCLSIPTFASGQTDSNPNPVFVPSRWPAPSIVVGHQFGKIGTGYAVMAADGQTEFYTVFHAVSGNEPVFGTIINGKNITAYDCLLFSRELQDGTCKVGIDPGIEPNMVRQPQEATQVVVWSRELEIWMPFEIVASRENQWMIRGQFIDLNNDNYPDMTGTVCSKGYSGSPVVLAQDGWPVFDQNGYLISVGEVVGLAYSWDGDGTICSNIVAVFTFSFDS